MGSIKSLSSESHRDVDNPKSYQSLQHTISSAMPIFSGHFFLKLIEIVNLYILC